MPFGRRQENLTPADMLMAVSQHGLDEGVPEMDDFQSMLWNLVGVPGEAGTTERAGTLRAVVESPLKEHEAAICWIVTELVRVAALKRDFDGLGEACELATRLGFKFEAYLRATGVVFLDVDVTDFERGLGYREFKPLPGTEALDIEEEFIAVGETFRRMRGAYGVSVDFIKTLKRQFASGEYRPPLTLVARAEIRHPEQVPPQPTREWSHCPNCSGQLKAVQQVAECLSCRHIWCDPRAKPTLDDSGKLIGSETRLLEIDDLAGLSDESVAVYIRGPRDEPSPLPD